MMPPGIISRVQRRACSHTAPRCSPAARRDTMSARPPAFTPQERMAILADSKRLIKFKGQTSLNKPDPQVCGLSLSRNVEDQRLPPHPSRKRGLLGRISYPCAFAHHSPHCCCIRLVQIQKIKARVSGTPVPSVPSTPGRLRPLSSSSSAPHHLGGGFDHMGDTDLPNEASTTTPGPHTQTQAPHTSTTHQPSADTSIHTQASHTGPSERGASSSSGSNATRSRRVDFKQKQNNPRAARASMVAFNPAIWRWRRRGDPTIGTRRGGGAEGRGHRSTRNDDDDDVFCDDEKCRPSPKRDRRCPRMHDTDNASSRPRAARRGASTAPPRNVTGWAPRM